MSACDDSGMENVVDIDHAEEQRKQRVAKGIIDMLRTLAEVTPGTPVPAMAFRLLAIEQAKSDGLVLVSTVMRGGFARRFVQISSKGRHLVAGLAKVQS